MAINQHLFLLTPTEIFPILGDEGWHYGKNFVFPVNRSNIEKTLSKYLERKDGWSPEVLCYEKDVITAKIFIKDGQDNDVESIELRVSLFVQDGISNGSSRQHSLDDIVRIADILKSISQEVNLKLFDPYKKKIVETRKDIVKSMCTSRPGKLYGYEKYLSLLESKANI